MIANKFHQFVRHTVSHLHEAVIALAVDEKIQIVSILLLAAAFLIVMAIQVAAAADEV